MDIRTIGIVGAGQMGRGIAQVCAQAGFDVTLTDIDAAALGAARDAAAAGLGRLVAKERLTEAERDAALARLTTTPTLTDLGPLDLIVEAATEDEGVKRRILDGLAPALGPETILTTNTSSISITRLAAATDRPERFMGFHFMNPVPVMKLVELIRGLQTSDATYEACAGIVARLGKTAATAADQPAFLVNRILIPMINEAVFALQEGVGDVASIDAAMVLGTNQPMGPLRLADLIGLDTCLSILRVLQEGTGDPKYRPCPLLVRHVEAGWLGAKSGRGFYDHAGDEPAPCTYR
ncbi:MAG: 3-hydroxybutyryl-CoA dehydrogenase [Paracoccaceae bacterium]